MPAINILNELERKLFDTPPRFTKEERKRYFSVPPELKQSVARIHPAKNRIGFIIQVESTLL